MDFNKASNKRYAMDHDKLLDALLAGKISKEQAVERLSSIDDIGYAQLDIQREHRTGFPEVIYGEGKQIDQLKGIVKRLLSHNEPILVTRVSKTDAEQLVKQFPELSYHPSVDTVNWRSPDFTPFEYGHIAVISAGTSDQKVAEEAGLTAEHLGSVVKRHYDIGVAGIHRFFQKLPEIKQASVVIVTAGMDGALPSIVGGLVDKPIIAIPTSVGYGANFGGLAPLLTMLNSCASGVTVVNIDNGFGGGYAAAQIHRNLNLFAKSLLKV